MPKWYGEFELNFYVVNEPTTFEEATSCNEWKDATQKEYDALIKNDTWRLVDPPIGIKPIGNKWVYKTKYKANGSLDKHKARLVGRGMHKKKVLIIQQLFLIQRNEVLLELYFLLQLKKDGKYITWM
jgi:hypothetical protein